MHRKGSKGDEEKLQHTSKPVWRGGDTELLASPSWSKANPRRLHQYVPSCNDMNGTAYGVVYVSCGIIHSPLHLKSPKVRSSTPLLENSWAKASCRTKIPSFARGLAWRFLQIAYYCCMVQQ